MISSLLPLSFSSMPRHIVPAFSLLTQRVMRCALAVLVAIYAVSFAWKRASRCFQREQEHSKIDGCLDALRRDPSSASAYFRLGLIAWEQEGVLEAAWPGEGRKTLSASDLFARAAALDPENGDILERLATSMPFKKTVKIGEKEWDQIDCWLEIVAKKPHHAMAHYYLAHLVDKNARPLFDSWVRTSDSSIQLRDGSMADSKSLLLKTIELKPHFANAYEALADCLESGEEISLPGGERVTKKELYIRAMEEGGEGKQLVYKLGLSIAQTTPVADYARFTLSMKGKEYRLKDLLLLADRERPQDYYLYYLLSSSIEPRERIQLSGRGEKLFDRIELLQASIALYPNYASSYALLADYLPPSQCVNLGRVEWSHEALFLKAIELCPSDSALYVWLASFMIMNHQREKRVRSIEGKDFSMVDLLLEADRLSPKRFDVYWLLSCFMEDEETVVLQGENSPISKETLYWRMFQWKKEHPELLLESANYLIRQHKSVILNAQSFSGYDVLRGLVAQRKLISEEISQYPNVVSRAYLALANEPDISQEKRVECLYHSIQHDPYHWSVYDELLNNPFFRGDKTKLLGDREKARKAYQAWYQIKFGGQDPRVL